MKRFPTMEYEDALAYVREGKGFVSFDGWASDGSYLSPYRQHRYGNGKPGGLVIVKLPDTRFRDLAFEPTPEAIADRYFEKEIWFPVEVYGHDLYRVHADGTRGSRRINTHW